MAIKPDSVNIGDRIEIKVKGQKKGKIYVSQVLDKFNENKYLISGPIQKSAFIPIHESDVIMVKYFKEGKGRFIFDAIVNKRIIDKVYKLEIERISNIKRLQERNYYRLPIKLKVIKNHKLEENGYSHEVEEECLTADLSGGGLKLLCCYRHEIGDEVICNFKEGLELTVIGEVIRVEEVENTEYKYAVGIKFTSLTEEAREQIIKFIFEEQRKLRKKGLI